MMALHTRRAEAAGMAGVTRAVKTDMSVRAVLLAADKSRILVQMISVRISKLGKGTTIAMQAMAG